MCSGAHEYDQAMFPVVVDLVGQQKITADMALPIPFPVATQRVIEPLRSKRASLAINKSMASLSRFMSYRPECDNLSQSFRKDFA